MKNLFLILFLFISSLSFSQEMMSVTPWIPSDQEGKGDYGKGLFWYRLYRSVGPVDGVNYKYSVSFISNSYYDDYKGEPYRTKTFLPNVVITEYGFPIINELYGSYDFWIIFLGDLENGIGFEGAVFYSPITDTNAFTMYWVDVIPY
jgi:hypothetical protein